jgi:hypothetical protein
MIRFIFLLCCGPNIRVTLCRNFRLTVIRQHQRTGFDGHVPGIGISGYASRQPRGSTRLPTRVNRPRHHGRDELQELGFRSTWIAHNTNINIRTQFDFIGCFLLHTADELEENSFFDVDVAIYVRRDRLCQQLEAVALAVGVDLGG